MKRLSFGCLTVIALLVLSARADHIYVSGDVSGFWTADTVFVQGEINVPASQLLTINPGVKVIFEGLYALTVNSNAILNAVGSEQDTILFTASNPDIGWGSIRFLSANPSSQLKYCHLEYGKSYQGNTTGGGISVYNSAVLIQHCRIEKCRARSSGGGINISTWNYGLRIDANEIRFDTVWASSVPGSPSSGGGICIENCAPQSDSIICSNNVLYSNYVYGNGNGFGGGLAFYTSKVYLINNLIFENFSGGGATGYGGGIAVSSNCIFAKIENCTFSGNNSYHGGGLYGAGMNAFVKNCIIWSNIPNQIFWEWANPQIDFSDFQGGWPGGIGNINADPEFIEGYHLKQIASGQPVQSPCVDAGDTASPMIIGTTRTDGIQDEGEVDMGYHYPNITYAIVVNMEPVNPPIVLPPTGGSFNYTINLLNTTQTMQSTNFWANITLPNNFQFTALGPFNLSLPGGLSVTRLRTQTVPATAPAGLYYYWGIVGTYPWIINRWDYFTFVKVGGNDYFGTEGWYCTGELLPGEVEMEETSNVVAEFGLAGAFPNPFNPSTVIRYQMPEARHVSLRVYDTAGRLVSTLVDGYRAAGSHEVTLDGSNLATGVYLYRIQAGSWLATGKMVMVK